MNTYVKETLTITADPKDLQGAKVLNTLVGDTPSIEKINASIILAAQFRKATEEKAKEKPKSK